MSGPAGWWWVVVVVRVVVVLVRLRLVMVVRHVVRYDKLLTGAECIDDKVK